MTAKASGKKYLVVVESPTKQKTIGKILGPEYVVRSSFGHVRDLPERELGVDEKNGFKPTYVIIPKAKKNITELKTAYKDADLLYLATDPDREGESIAWHLVEALSPDMKKVKRIAFHEITPGAIRESFNNARDIDDNLVEAQQARRVLDRLVGYKLSPLLWRKISKGLSAGRVQSVAVRILVERAKEIAEFPVESYYAVEASLSKPGLPPDFNARLYKWKGEPAERSRVLKLFAEDYRVRRTVFSEEAELNDARKILSAGPLKVASVERKETRQRPKPPFITSSLQQDAHNKLGFSSQRTMQVAQSLYEGIELDGQTVGLITYMRTDSFNVSKDIQKESREYIAAQYGAAFAPEKPPFYGKKVKGAQEAHEAIHPTSVAREPEQIRKYLSGEQAKLYELIWRRFLSSQMADAVFDTLGVEIAAGPDCDSAAPQCVLKTGGRTVKFEGFLKVYKGEESDDENEEETEENAKLPLLEKGDALELKGIDAASRKTSPPPMYNEASLIKTLEKHGIGRPSTYAPIVKTIQDRKYAERQGRSGKLAPTELGTTVTEKLKGFFPELMELSYTAEIEDRLDDVASGSAKWAEVVAAFYGPFTADLAKAYTGMEAEQPQEVADKCPVCGGPMLLRESRFGKYISCANFPKCKGKIRLD
ncbi:MAG: type I DNA topoisomerase, partial [Elusimicrobiaceae bacterium]|nr:type I DNA topoisomerase [Elusimicrobiaceae bacterium]